MLVKPVNDRPLKVLACALAVTVTTALVTSITTVFEMALYDVRSVGVNVTSKVCAMPALRMVPMAGIYEKVPGTEAVALSWVAESAVP